MSGRVPDAILQKHIGILGVTGSGKTFTAKGLAERLLDQGQRVCAIDPTGIWYGLKSSATGKSAGYPVVIFGGQHADVQITGSHGEAIAEAIGTSSTSAIIDVSLMRGGERTRFFADFAETLRIKNQGPLHLFIDEGHLFCPQGRVADPQSANMLHAANNLISLGRSRGLRITLISQRPAKVHKDSLSQINTLIAMRLIAPQDRAAVEAWIADQADVTKGKDIIASLPSLKTGEGWVWSPEIGILERVKFPKIATFDSSKAPDAGSSGPAIVLAPINLDAIQGKLASLKQDKVANDPIALKRRVAELEEQLRAKPPAASTDTKAIIAATAEAYRKGFDEGVEAYGTAFAAVRATLASKVFAEISGTKLDRPKTPKPAKSHPAVPSAPPVESTPKRDQSEASALTGPQRRIINSITFWQTIGHNQPSREQVAAVAGYSAGGGSFRNTLGQLHVAGMIDYPTSGNLSLSTTTSGDPLTMTEAAKMLRSILTGPEQKIVAAFGADPMTRDDVATATGYEAGGGSFRNTVCHLNVLNILHRPSAGMLALTDWARELLT